MIVVQGHLKLQLLLIPCINVWVPCLVQNTKVVVSSEINITRRTNRSNRGASKQLQLQGRGLGIKKGAGSGSGSESDPPWRQRGARSPGGRPTGTPPRPLRSSPGGARGRLFPRRRRRPPIGRKSAPLKWNRTLADPIATIPGADSPPMCPVSARADGLGDLDWGLRRRGASAVERALGIPRFIAVF